MLYHQLTAAVLVHNTSYQQWCHK